MSLVLGALAAFGAAILVVGSSRAQPAEPEAEEGGGGAGPEAAEGEAEAQGGSGGAPAAEANDGGDEGERAAPAPEDEEPAPDPPGAGPGGLPDLDLDDPDEPAPKPKPKPAPSDKPTDEPPDEATAADDKRVYDLGTKSVTGQRRKEATTGARYELPVGKLSIIPRKDASKQLMLAPGVLTINHGGEGHAHQTFMRGFNAGEGKDIEFTMNGVPINEVSNTHNHGYADLWFMPPELVRSVVVTEGPFDPVQGDFAFAGSADYRLGVAERGSIVKYGFGRWDTHRLLLLYAPEGEPEETFGAFELYRTSGFGANRAAQRGVAIGRYSSDDADAPFRWGLGAVAYTSRYDQPGVVRQDDYELGRMGFFDTYDSNQGGESNRLLLSFDTALGPDDGRFEQVTFLGYRTMRIRANFTGWMNDTDVTTALVPGVTEQRGDGVEMRYDTVTGGSRGQYSFAGHVLDHEQRMTVGYAARFDHGGASQLRLRSVTAIPYKRLYDREFTVVNVAGWTRLNLRPWRRLALSGGARVDGFGFGVTDLNQPTADREGPREPDQTAQSFGFAVNPRAAVDFTVVKGLHVLGSYGMGTRSSDAAALSDNESAPFARAHVVDGGLAYHYGKQGDPFALHSQVSYSYAKIDKDLLFDETAGRNLLVGGSTRHAVLGTARAYVGEWFDTLLNVGWANATLDDTGELVPYIPELVLRLDAAVSAPLSDWQVGQVPVTARGGVGITFVPGVPLPLQEYGDTMFLTNLGGEVRLWHTSLGVEMRNLLNLEYRQSEFNYSSNFASADAALSKVSQRHFVAGEPFFAMGTLTLHMEAALRQLSNGAPDERPNQP